VGICQLNIIMLLHELYDEPQLDELDLKKAARGAIMGLGLGAAGVGAYGVASKANNPPAAITQPAPKQDAIGDILKQVPDVKAKKELSTSQTANKAEEGRLLKIARQAGMKGDELAAFMAQMAHETYGFERFIELGDNAYFKRIYDIKGMNPKKAEQLGNVKPGDGARYKGRGYIHLTGRDNYRKAGTALGLPLEQQPELAADPIVAAKIALWFWDTRVKPNVSDWDDVRSVTRRINHAMAGIQDREVNYHDYRKKIR
jgi:predicted chitinase